MSTLLGQLLLERTRANLENKNKIQQSQAEGLINSMHALNPDGTPALSPEALASAQDQLNKLLGMKGTDPAAKEQSRIMDVFHNVIGTLHGHARAHAESNKLDQSLPPLPPDQSQSAMPSTEQMASGDLPAPTAAAPRISPLPPPIQFSDVMAQAAGANSKPALAKESLNEEMSKRDTEATAAGLQKGSREYQHYMATGQIPSSAAFLQVNQKLFDKDTGESFLSAGISPDGNGYMDISGAVHTNVRPSTATDASTVKKLQSPPGGGAPVGVQMGNQSWAVGDPNMPSDAKDYLDKGVKEYNSHQLTLTERGESIARARAREYAKYQPVEVLDSTTGNVAMITKDKIAANSGRYVSGSQAQQIATKDAMFKDIHRDSDQLSASIDNLTDSDFSPTQRAKLAVVMRATDPMSALSEFITSSAADGMTQPQIDYVTSIASMAESAMALRQAGGLSGQSSDLLRSAIGAMIPTAGTPSKSYAKLQMNKFNKDLDTLEQGRLGIANFAPRPGATPKIPKMPAAKGSSIDDEIMNAIPR